MSRTRVLVVAAPFVSQGGVYTSLRRTLPLLEAHGIDVGVAWSSRVPGGDMPGMFVRRLSEARSPLLRAVALARSVDELADEWDPDVLLSVLPQSDVACARVSRRRRTPWVAMIRGRPFPTGDEAPAWKQRLWRLAVQRAYRTATWRLAISQALADEARSALGITIDQVLHNGVDLDGFVRTVSPREPHVGFVGRLTTDKAPDILVDIARRLDIPVRIIGDGPRRRDLEAAALTDPRIEVVGWLSPHEAMASLDVLVVPSIREGLGNVILEAGAAGVAVVARSVGGIPEILGRDPILAERCLVPPNADGVAFARAVAPLVADAAWRREAADRLHAVVHEHFTVQQAAAGLARTLTRVSRGGP